MRMVSRVGHMPLLATTVYTPLTLGVVLASIKLALEFVKLLGPVQL